MLNRGNLHPYQRRAVALMLSQPKVYLAIGMGLGKTASALTAIVDLKASGEKVKALVIAPKRVAESVWPEEPGKWQHLSGLTVSVVSGTVAQRAMALSREADIYVIGRDNTQWLIEHLRKWPFNLLIIDEADSFKNAASKRFKFLKRIRADVDRCWLLSGTPGSYLDLWSQYFLLDGGERLGRTLSAYRGAWFDQDYMGWSWTIKQGAAEAIQKKIADITVSMSAEDYLELPDRIDNVITIRLDGASRTAYKTLERDYVLQHQGATLTAANAAVLAGKLLQLANGAIYDDDRRPVEIHTAKLDALDEIVGSGPLLVFYLFRHDLERIKARYPKAREMKTPQDVTDWNNNAIDLLVVHPASCGHGLNLQGAQGSAVVWFGLPWSLFLYQQANARIHRQGVKHTVVVHHILVEDSIDQDVMSALDSKAIDQDRLLNALKERINELQ